MADQPKLPDESSKHSGAQIDEAQSNLEACLEAYDKEGKPGLQAELARIHPEPSGHRRIPLPNLPGSFARVLPDHVKVPTK